MNWGIYGFPELKVPRVQRKRFYNAELPYQDKFHVWFQAKHSYTDNTMSELCDDEETIGFIPDLSGNNRHYYYGAGLVRKITDNGFPAIFVENGYLITAESFSLPIQIVVFRSLYSTWSTYNVVFSQYGSYTSCRQYLFRAGTAGGWHVAPATIQHRNGAVQGIGTSIAPINLPMVCVFGHRFVSTAAPWVSGWDHGSNSRDMIIYEIIGASFLSTDQLLEIQASLMDKYNIT